MPERVEDRDMADIGLFVQQSDDLLMLLVGAVCAVFAARIINSLRTEAFQAKKLGRYRLGERIGLGGMGEVYLAEHRLLKRRCAIKLIRPDKAGDPETLARFQREARTTASLSHPNTIEIYDYGTTVNGTFFYAMEYLPGMDLAELVDRFGPLLPERAIHLLRQVCGALAELHRVGFIHRDIKPGNIFCTYRRGKYDIAKLLDFGLARPTSGDQDLRLKEVIVRCLAKDPLERYPSAQALAESLSQCEAANRWTNCHAAQWWQSSDWQQTEKPLSNQPTLECAALRTRRTTTNSQMKRRRTHDATFIRT
jgi:serine/threonine protein kinase